MRLAPDVVVDIAIFGGGIAGLWLLDRLQREGFSAVLLEADQLGAGQSVASQGIIHGGTKYTFGLMMDSAVKELRQMPAAWRESLGTPDGLKGAKGANEPSRADKSDQRRVGSIGPDLSQARTLSSRTYMWVPRQLGGGVLGAFSRMIMRSRVRALARSQWPDGLDSQGVAGAVYALDELVLDVPSVLEALQANRRERIRRIPDRHELSFADADGDDRVGAKIGT